MYEEILFMRSSGRSQMSAYSSIFYWERDMAKLSIDSPGFVGTAHKIWIEEAPYINNGLRKHSAFIMD